MLKLNTLSGFGSGAAAGGVASNAYFLGGSVSGVTKVVADKLTFATDTTVATTTADLTVARSYSAGVSDSSTNGYVGGGDTHEGAITALTDKLVFSTDTTAAETTANLTSAKQALAGASDGSTNGYYAGGVTTSSVRVVTTDKLVFSTDTTAAETTANLTLARRNLTGMSSSTDGYFGGGNSGAPDTETPITDKLVFSTDTTAAETSANLVHERFLLSACSGDGVNGYWSGGYEEGALATTERLVYSTDTTSAITTADLPAGRYGLAGTSDGSVNGYFGGGAGNNVEVEQLVYATEVMAASTTRDLSLGRTALSAVSSVSV